MKARLKTSIIASILPADLEALRDPVHGDLLLDIPTILAHVAKIHGNVTVEELRCGRLRRLRNCSHRQTFSSTWPSSPKGTRRCTSKSPLHHPAFSPSLGRFYEKACLPFLTPYSKACLPFPCSFRRVGFPRAPDCCPCSCPASLSKTALKKAARKAKKRNSLPPNTLPCWPIWQGRVLLSCRISRREL